MSETAPEADATETTAQDATTTDTDAAEKDWQAEADKWKTLARKQEQRAKENHTAAEQLKKLREAQMNDHELAIAAAADKARTGAVAEMGSRMVVAEFRAASQGRLSAEDLDAIGVDLTRYLTDAGEVDVDKVAIAADRLAPAKGNAPVDLGQGARGGNQPSVEQQIAEATKRGDWRTVISLQNSKLGALSS